MVRAMCTAQTMKSGHHLQTKLPKSGKAVCSHTGLFLPRNQVLTEERRIRILRHHARRRHVAARTAHLLQCVHGPCIGTCQFVDESKSQLKERAAQCFLRMQGDDAHCREQNPWSRSRRWRFRALSPLSAMACDSSSSCCCSAKVASSLLAICHSAFSACIS